MRIEPRFASAARPAHSTEECIDIAGSVKDALNSDSFANRVVIDHVIPKSKRPQTGLQIIAANAPFPEIALKGRTCLEDMRRTSPPQAACLVR
jgi:hypothetical protein